MNSVSLLLSLVPALALAVPVPDVRTEPLQVREDGPQSRLFGPDGAPVATLAAGAREARLLTFDGGDGVLLWRGADGVERYRLRIGAAQTFSRERSVEPWVHLRRGTFDPAQGALAPLPGLGASGDLFIVQFVTQSIEAYRSELEALGADVRSFLPDAAHVVRMDAETAALVAALPFVRATVPYTAGDRLDEALLGEWPGRRRVHVQVFERGPAMKGRVQAQVRALGGEIVWSIDEGFRFDALLDAAQVRQVAALDDVLWMDPWTPIEEDMDKVRVDGGADSLETVAGYTGTGVRAEACDGNVLGSHPDLQSNPILFHGSTSGSASHGTPVTGIVFGDGAANASRRGLLPDAQPIFADNGSLGNRYTHTAELLAAPYEAVFQTNSWGNSRTTQYTSVSMQMDDILFLNDIVICQSQSNAGNPDSRPQAWAKNVVSVGGIRHYDTQSTADDQWDGSGSTGPAADGRLKPDLSYWYDAILTTGDNGASTQFGGTSAATPITAGYFGLFFEMWHAGEFGPVSGATVFESRPKATLARALMINTAARYGFSGASADLRRTTQGWGRANVQNLYDARGSLFLVNEDTVLAETQSAVYSLMVEPGTPELAVTMVYLDRAGTTSASVHRINDLSLRVTDPTGAVSYWGNNGLNAGNVSVAGGSSNTRDVVENVFVPSPVSGLWSVEVIADDLVEDTHVETAGIDADFALVVRGTSTTNADPCQPPQLYCPANPNSVSTLGAQLIFTGSNRVSQNDLVVNGFAFPASTFALLARSQVQSFAFIGQGTICIGNPLIRVEIVQADNLGVVSLPIDASALAPGGAVVPGETWNYQFWYRDGPTSNFSQAYEVTWCD